MCIRDRTNAAWIIRCNVIIQLPIVRVKASYSIWHPHLSKRQNTVDLQYTYAKSGVFIDLCVFRSKPLVTVKPIHAKLTALLAPK